MTLLPYGIEDSADTICAISTPPGIGGIAVARISGPHAFDIVDSIWHGSRSLSETPSHTARLGTISDSHGQPLDQAVATVYRAPHSYTGDNVVELSVHGSRWIQRELLNSLITAGCRMAEPGEFTRRAFSAGRLGLTEAEAVADMISADSRAAHRIAIRHLRGGFSKRLEQLREQLLTIASLVELELDFSEEDVEFASRDHLRQLTTQLHNELQQLSNSFATGTAIKEGIPVAIVGPTNAGKSSLLNALVGDDRAIVSDIHGTTRDVIEDTIEIGDYRLRILDTAGLRQTTDTIEQLGIERSHRAASTARIVLLIADSTRPLPAPTLTLLNQLLPAPDSQNVEAGESAAYSGADERVVIMVINKCDHPESDPAPYLEAAKKAGIGTVAISALQQTGIDTLRQLVTDTLDRQTDRGTSDNLLITNARQAQALSQAAQSTARIIEGIDSGLSGDFLAQDIRQTLHHLSTITGQITTPDILQTIFTRFCIGK